MMRKASAIGLGLILLSFPLHPVAGALYPVYDYWHLSPSFVLLRLGLVLLLCSGLFLYEQRQGVKASSVVTLFGRESLIVYVTHLTILYGNFTGDSLVGRLGGSFTYPEAIGATLVLVLLMGGLALLWGRIKKGRTGVKVAIEVAFVALVILFFFFGSRLQPGAGRAAPLPVRAPASFPPGGGLTQLWSTHEKPTDCSLRDDDPRC